MLGAGLALLLLRASSAPHLLYLPCRFFFYRSVPDGVPTVQDRQGVRHRRRPPHDYFGDNVGSDACKVALDCCCYPCMAWHQNVFLQEMRAFGHAEEAGDIVVTREPGGV